MENLPDPVLTQLWADLIQYRDDLARLQGFDARPPNPEVVSLAAAVIKEAAPQIIDAALGVGMTKSADDKPIREWDSILVRVPEEVKEAMILRARANGRSMQAEMLSIVERDLYGAAWALKEANKTCCKLEQEKSRLETSLEIIKLELRDAIAISNVLSRSIK